jgi:DNA-binding HxlR family transcriptional regulator
MQHKSLMRVQCPIARSLSKVGEWWSILILRDVFAGLSRFDHFQKSLGIAPNMLTRRLKSLVEAGLLERRAYSAAPPRYEYVLTQKGRDFRPVIWALLAWGNKYLAPEGESTVVVDAQTGERVEPVLVDARTGRVLRAPEFKVAPGPAANARTRRRHLNIEEYIQVDLNAGASAAAARAPRRAKARKGARP